MAETPLCVDPKTCSSRHNVTLRYIMEPLSIEDAWHPDLSTRQEVSCHESMPCDPFAECLGCEVEKP